MTRVSLPQNIRSFRACQRVHCQRCAGNKIHLVTIQLSSLPETKKPKDSNCGGGEGIYIDQSLLIINSDQTRLAKIDMNKAVQSMSQY